MHFNRFGLEEGDTGDNWLLDEVGLEGTTTGVLSDGWCATIQGEVTHIGPVQIAATGVKTWSNGQATLRGAVKRSSGCFPLYTAL